MTPEQLFEQMLGLSEHWAITEVEYLDGETAEVRIVIEDRPSLIEAIKCEEDGSDVYCYDHSKKRVWRHLNIFEHACYIECALPRYKCRKCEKVKRVKAPWEGKIKGFTLMFEAFALGLIREMPVRSAARILKEHDTRLWRMLQAYVDEAYSALDFSEAKSIACDETSVRWGHNYITVFADLERRSVLFATDGRYIDSWERFALELPKHNADCSQIKTISMDMSGHYRAGARKYCPQATIIFDRFHIMRLVNKSLNEVREKENRLLCKKGDTRLKGTLWLWRMNESRHTNSQALLVNQLSKTNLLTAKAYQMKTTLQDIYELRDIRIFKHKLQYWIRWVKRYTNKHPYVFSSMKRSALTIENHFDGIIAYAENRLSNAFMEGLFSVFSAARRKARGFRTNRYLITVLYLVASKLNIPTLA